MTPTSFVIVCLACCCCAATGQGAGPLAFAGAEGFAARATDGRGGQVFHVTNLEDDGPGSLRDGVSKGPRIVVFDVGGYVRLKQVLHVASDITIAGQTSPGEGVGIMGHEVSFSGSHSGNSPTAWTPTTPLTGTS